MVLNQLDKYRDHGLLILRIGIGVMFILHGYPKLMGGPDKWMKIGEAMGNLQIGSGYIFWGFMAAFAEFFGGILLVLGLLFRPACLVLFITMVVAWVKHVTAGDSFNSSSHALEAAILFFSLLFIGPGRFSIDSKFTAKKANRLD